MAVVIPTYDRPRLLRAAIRSVLEQDYEGHITVLVVFDRHSADASLTCELDLRKVATLSNERSPGLAGARNTGLIAVDDRFSFVAFLDDDDEWSPTKLSTQIGLLLSNPRAVAAGCGIALLYHGRTKHRMLADTEVGLGDLLQSRILELHPSTLVVRQPIVELAGLVDEGIPYGYAEDYDWILRVAQLGSIIVAPSVLATIRRGRSSYFAEDWEGMIAGLRYLLEKHAELRHNRRSRARIEGKVAFAHAALGRRTKALRQAAIAWCARPFEPRPYLAVLVVCRLLSSRSILHLLHLFGRGL